MSQREKRSERNGVIVVVGLVSLIVVIIGVETVLSATTIPIPASYESRSASTTTTNNSTPASAVTCCLVNITKVVLDQVYDPGYSYYYIDVDIAYSGNSVWQIIPFNFQLVSNSSALYGVTPLGRVRFPLGFAVLRDGQHTRGEVGFRLPRNQVPSRLAYVVGDFNVQAQVPAVTSWASLFNQKLNVDLRGPNGEGSVAVVAGALVNQSQFFRTGQTVEVEIMINKESGSALKIISVEALNQLQVTAVRPSLPFTSPADSKQLDLTVDILAPPFTYSGIINLVVNFSN